MGYTRNDPDDWKAYTTTTSTKSRDQIFTVNNGMIDEFNPANIDIRESRDSTANPQSTPIVIGADVTGSLGRIAEVLVRKSIGTFFEEVIKRKTVSDPHLALFAIGDVITDNAPLQMTQFEADSVTLATQLERIFIEGRGGSNDSESYHLAWLAAAEKTAIDSMEKRKKKGYLFTYGDEEVPPALTANQIRKVFGTGMELRDLSPRNLLAMASRKYEIFHLVIEEGHYARRAGRTQVLDSWRELLGERTIPVSDYTKLSEIIISLIEVHEGRDRDSVVGSWDGSTSMVVAHATENVKGGLVRTGSNKSGLVKF